MCFLFLFSVYFSFFPPLFFFPLSSSSSSFIFFSPSLFCLAWCFRDGSVFVICGERRRKKGERGGG
jgi:hypothetical protein